LSKPTEQTLIDEVVAFVLEAQADFLRNAEDTHDWNDAPSRNER